MNHELRGTILSIPIPASPQVRAEATMGFGRHVTCRRLVGVPLEEHPALCRRQVAALRRRRRMDERPLCRIAQERLRDLRSPLPVGFVAVAFGGPAFRLVRAFELMIPRGLPKQLVHVWRHVVRGRRVDAHDALLAIELVPRTQLESRDAFGVDADEM